MGFVSNAQDNVSEFAWKWRCKISPPKEGSDRTLKKIESFDSDSTTDVKNLANKATPTTQPKVCYWYEGPKSSHSSGWDWQDYPPKPMSESTMKALEEHAIAVYKVKDTQKVAVGNRYPLKVYQIFIHEPLLLQALQPILKKHGTHVNVQISLEMMAPFAPLYFGMPEIIALYKATSDETPLKGLLELLIKVLDDVFFTIKKQVRSLRAQRLITYEQAWMFFPTDTILYTYGRNSEMLSKVVTCEKGGTRLTITVKTLTFDGNGFVWREKKLHIPRFEGNIPITELSHYPIEFHEDSERLKRQLMDRGRKVLDLQGLHYRTYDGIAQELGKGNASHNVEGRILIDMAGYNKYHLSQGKREAGDPETVRNAETTLVRANESEAQDGNNSSLKRLSEEEQARNKAEMLEKEHLLMFIDPLIMGYALKNKMWCK